MWPGRCTRRYAAVTEWRLRPSGALDGRRLSDQTCEQGGPERSEGGRCARRGQTRGCLRESAQRARAESPLESSHTNEEPSLERVGDDPSAQAGWEPSSQLALPSAAIVGEEPSSQVAPLADDELSLTQTGGVPLDRLPLSHVGWEPSSQVTVVPLSTGSVPSLQLMVVTFPQLPPVAPRIGFEPSGQAALEPSLHWRLEPSLESVGVDPSSQVTPGAVTPGLGAGVAAGLW